MFDAFIEGLFLVLQWKAFSLMMLGMALGFAVAVAHFYVLYLSFQARVGLQLSVTLTAVAWLFFYGLFQRTLHLPFEDGLIQTWLGM